MKSSASLLFVVPAFLFTVSAAVAESDHVINDHDGRPKLMVAYSDLNVNSPNGAKVLLARLEAAAKRVCGPEPMPLNLNAGGRFKRCTRQAVDEAVAGLHQPQVAAVYTGRRLRLAQGD